jgi:hypothetical protein
VATIDERTKVSLYALAVVLPAAVGVLVWSVNVSMTAADAREISRINSIEIKRNRDELKEIVIEIDKRTIRIEESLKHRSR